MTGKRMAATIAAAFVVSQILAGAIHGFLLASDYGPYYGRLLRSQGDPTWPFLLLPVSHLSFIASLVWIYSRIGLSGSTIAQGLKLGILGWLAGQVPLWLLWFAEQPWPGTLVVKQLGYELVSSLIIGVTIALVAGRGSERPVRASAPASTI